MQYKILHIENQIEISGFYYTIPKSYEKLEYILPFSQDGDKVFFETQTGVSLNERIRYISELDFLTYVYLIAKHADAINKLSDGLLSFALDLQMIYCDGNSLAGAILPSNTEKTTDFKGFFWDILFSAGFVSKDLPTVKEFLGFIRAAISVMPQDVILFIEMGQLGKQIVERTSGKALPEIAKEPKKSQTQKEDINSQLQTGNDFSDFLTAFESSSYEYEEDENVVEDEAVDLLNSDDLSYDEFANILDNAEVSDELKNDIRSIDPDILMGLLKDYSNKDVNESDDIEEKNVENKLPSDEQDVSEERNIEPASEEEEDDILDEPIPEIEEKNIEPVFEEEEDDILDEPIPEVEEKSIEPVFEEEEDDILDEPIPEAEEKNIEPVFEEEEDSVLDEPIPEYEEDILNVPVYEKENKLSDEQSFKIDKSKPAVKAEKKAENVEITPIIPSSVHRFNNSPAGRVPHQKETPVYVEKVYLVSSDGRNIPLIKEKTVIGRGTQNVDLTINDGFVSRVHAQIVKQGTDMYLIDLKPRNPSVLNDKPIEAEKAYVLKDEDRIRFGKTLYYFRIVKMKQ